MIHTMLVLLIGSNTKPISGFEDFCLMPVVYCFLNDISNIFLILQASGQQKRHGNQGI